MTDTCILCHGKIDADPSFKGLSHCGYCLRTSLEQKWWREEIENSVTRIFQGLSRKDECRNILEKHSFSAEELALTLWEWNLEYLHDINLSFLKSLGIQKFNSAIEIIEENSIAIEFYKHLNTESSKQDIIDFFDENHHLIRLATGYYHFGDAGYCFSNFKLDTEHKIDFLIINPRRSIAPLINLVSFGSVSDKLFTKEGLLSSALGASIKDLRSFYSWINHNNDDFRLLLKRKLKNALDPVSLDSFFYHREVELNTFIFMGRRSAISENDHRNEWSSGEINLTIHSYDSILDDCINCDGDLFEQKQEIEDDHYIKQKRSEGYVPSRSIEDWGNHSPE